MSLFPAHQNYVVFYQFITWDAVSHLFMGHPTQIIFALGVIRNIYRTTQAIHAYILHKPPIIKLFRCMTIKLVLRLLSLQFFSTSLMSRGRYLKRC
jgi:hypothetical protein